MTTGKRRRVIVSGLGIVSALGNSYKDVIDALKHTQSGVVAAPDWAEYGITSLVAGRVDMPGARLASAIGPELRNGMTDAGLFCAAAALDAVADADLTPDHLASHRTACIVGNGDSSLAAGLRLADLARDGEAHRISPFAVLQCMANSASAGVASLLGVLGPSYSLAGACATSAHCIGHGANLIRSGAVDLAIVGGGEGINAIVAAGFEGMRTALSTGYNDRPQEASRPFDANRDGLVLSGGAGILVLEEINHARRRGARARAEIAGYGATSDANGLVAPLPSGDQAAQCMMQALNDAGARPADVDYVNAHATATIPGDLAETLAIRTVFEDAIPPLSSTKSMSGHALSAAGVHEAIYSIAMLENGFLAASMNIDQIDPAFADLPVIRETQDTDVHAILSNSFGFGGTNAALFLQRAPTQ